MPTQKPISTISYNTVPFLRERLDQLVENHTIQAYMYICHKGEDGDKDHIHLRVEPNKRIDPMDLTEFLKEYPSGDVAKKPLGVRPWRPSSEADWFLYVVHDPQYLRYKYLGGEKGEKIPYDWQVIQVSEYYDLEVAWVRAKATMLHSSPSLTARLQAGEEAVSLINEGENVFLVNALVRALTNHDYQKMSDEYYKLRGGLSSLAARLSHYDLYFDVDDQYRFQLHDFSDDFEISPQLLESFDWG